MFVLQSKRKLDGSPSLAMARATRLAADKTQLGEARLGDRERVRAPLNLAFRSWNRLPIFVAGRAEPTGTSSTDRSRIGPDECASRPGWITNRYNGQIQSCVAD